MESFLQLIVLHQLSCLFCVWFPFVTSESLIRHTLLWSPLISKIYHTRFLDTTGSMSVDPRFSLYNFTTSISISDPSRMGGGGGGGGDAMTNCTKYHVANIGAMIGNCIHCFLSWENLVHILFPVLVYFLLHGLHIFMG